MMAILGWLVMCVIAGGFWLGAGFWFFVGTVLKGGSEVFIMVLILGVLAVAFSYGVVVHYPFEPLVLKGAS